jgi:anti-sigma regulatory factor (Ser/Thr protein kinase)
METNENTQWSEQIQLSNETSECNRLFEFLATNLQKLPVTKEFRHDLKLVSEELLANIIKHGYDQHSDEKINIELAVDGSSVRLTFTDSAREFNPLEHNSPGILNDLSAGGMGIMLVKSLTDEQSYMRDNNHNVFTVTKNYNT